MPKSHRRPAPPTPAATPEQRVAPAAPVSNAERQEALKQQPPAQEEGGWLDFLVEGAKNLEFDGMIDRFQQARAVRKAIEAGADPASLGIDEKDYRLRNVAEMSDVAEDVEGKVDHPAAHSLRDANFAFYTLFGNNGGSFEGMDMTRYREIAAMPGEQAAEVLPEFEADTFAKVQDPDTVAFGNSLPAAQRKQLFKLHNQLLTPGQGETE